MGEMLLMVMVPIYLFKDLPVLSEEGQGLNVQGGRAQPGSQGLGWSP